MTKPQQIEYKALVAEIIARAAGRSRLMVAITGAPAAGKSTLAAALCDEINASSADHPAIVVPMDGFHYDNAVLDARGHRARKGAPHSFDAAGFKTMLSRLKTGDGEVAVPLFDRVMDLARAGAALVTEQHRIVLVEGNYLLLNQPVWRDLHCYFDISITLQVPFPILEQRLIQRWLDHGANYEAARARALANDIPNAQTVVEQSFPAEFTLQTDFVLQG
ncbi:nucleoside triphosphate hydrolase [Pseudochrobactrum sp. HB0163]|uniref:nucleoside triphosphate hydrolase n=1 Tax=Pseudochrobactrum sp. HB0163 TaxID=3450708 RepID=UPI003F6DFED8